MKIRDLIESVHGAVNIASFLGAGTNVGARIPPAANIFTSAAGSAWTVEDQPADASRPAVRPIVGG